MATSGKINGTAKNNGVSLSNYEFWADWKRNSYSIEDNKSNITVSLKIKRTDNEYGAWNLEVYPSVSLKVNGSAKTPNITFIDTRNYVTCTFATWTGDVTHNDDGTLACPISASFTHYGSDSLDAGTLSGNAKLDSIPRTSVPTVDKTSVQMGSSVTITTNRKAASLTHTLTYSFGGATGTIATNVGASYKWTVPDLAAKISGKTSGSCTITCKTYSGSTHIGSSTVSLTLTVHDKSVPTTSASTVQMGKSVDIYTNRKSTAYTHTLKYTIGSKTDTIRTAVGGCRTWTPPKDLAAYTGNKTSATCTITCQTYNGTALVGTATTTITLTVPNATVPTLSATSANMGSSITISTPRETSAYTHDLTYTFVGSTGNISTGVGTSYAWSIPLSLASKIPSDTSGTITVTCTTKFEDGTVVGKNTKTFTANVPNNSTTQPKLTMALSCVHDLPSKFAGIYVEGKSKVKVTHTASTDYSTIESYYTTVRSASSISNPYTSSVLTTSGSVSITGKVTDGRGYSTTKTSSITVVPYSRPRIIPGSGQKNIVCKRCNSNGVADAGGAYLLIKIGRKYSKVESDGQKNFCKLSYRHKTDAQGDSGYSDPITLLEGSATTDYVSVVLSNIVPNNTIAYTIQLIAEDDIGESDVVTVTIPTAFITFHAPEGGHGFTLGGYHDPSKKDVFDCRFNAEFQGNVSGAVLGMGALPVIPVDADYNDYKTYGVYAVTKNATAKTLKNRPCDLAGTLRVWSGNGNGTSAEEWTYIIQEYICYDNSATYRRSMKLESASSSWEIGEWTFVGNYSYGVTDSWYWKKYADGTAECWRRVKNTNKSISTQFGSMYYGDCDEVTFPFSFYSAPVVNATVESGSAMSLMSWQGTDGNGTTTATKPASFRVIRPTSTTGVSFTISYHAIGRWKS